MEEKSSRATPARFAVAQCSTAECLGLFADAQGLSHDVGRTKDELQATFTSAITSAAFSLSSTGKLDYAWASFEGALKNGKLFRAREK